jgi:hypothetical protein
MSKLKRGGINYLMILIIILQTKMNNFNSNKLKNDLKNLQYKKIIIINISS